MYFLVYDWPSYDFDDSHGDDVAPSLKLRDRILAPLIHLVHGTYLNIWSKISTDVIRELWMSPLLLRKSCPKRYKVGLWPTRNHTVCRPKIQSMSINLVKWERVLKSYREAVI